jgi:hypothetical protein
MNGYVARKGNRWCAVIYEGLDPVTGREIRRWHGTSASCTATSSRRSGPLRSDAYRVERPWPGEDPEEDRLNVWSSSRLSSRVGRSPRPLLPTGFRGRGPMSSS